MVKRALCVGCNYTTKKHGLEGAVNDAFLIADCLQRSCGFEPDDIHILHDMLPGQAKSSHRLVDPCRYSTRSNILQQLQWLTRSARAGDVLFFSFAGYGLQVDDVDGYHDDGLDEAILPTDFADGVGRDLAVIVMSDIHDALMSVPQDVTVTVVMDCDNATSVVDVSGTIDGALVKGLKLNSTCGFKAQNAKMQPAEHDRGIWLEEAGGRLRARPRYQPTAEISNPRKGKVPSRTAMSKLAPQAYCYSASGHGQTALEMQIVSVVDGSRNVQQHGVLSWSFVHALEDLKCHCTHAELIEAVAGRIYELQFKHLARMDQQAILTFSQPRSDPNTAKVFEHVPVEPVDPADQVNSRRSVSTSFRTIVPPPPPGYLATTAPRVEDGEHLRQPPDSKLESRTSTWIEPILEWDGGGVSDNCELTSTTGLSSAPTAQPREPLRGVASRGSDAAAGSEAPPANSIVSFVPSHSDVHSTCSPTSSEWEAATWMSSEVGASSSDESDPGGWEAIPQALGAWINRVLDVVAPPCGGEGQVSKRNRTTTVQSVDAALRACARPDELIL